MPDERVEHKGYHASTVFMRLLRRQCAPSQEHSCTRMFSVVSLPEIFQRNGGEEGR